MPLPAGRRTRARRLPRHTGTWWSRRRRPSARVSSARRRLRRGDRPRNGEGPRGAARVRDRAARRCRRARSAWICRRGSRRERVEEREPPPVPPAIRMRRIPKRAVVAAVIVAALAGLAAGVVLRPVRRQPRLGRGVERRRERRSSAWTTSAPRSERPCRPARPRRNSPRRRLSWPPRTAGWRTRPNRRGWPLRRGRPSARTRSSERQPTPAARSGSPRRPMRSRGRMLGSALSPRPRVNLQDRRK